MAVVMLASTLVGSVVLLERSGFIRGGGDVVTSRLPGRFVRWFWPFSVMTMHFWSLGVLVLPDLFHLFPIPPGDYPDLLQWTGVVIWAGSGILILWSTWVMGRSMRPQVQMSSGQRLVTWGPFRWVRHPVYLGNILAGAGMSLAYLSLPCLFLTMAALLVALRRTAMEEEMLSSPLAFGAEYEGYASSTGRFLPRRSR